MSPLKPFSSRTHAVGVVVTVVIVSLAVTLLFTNNCVAADRLRGTSDEMMTSPARNRFGEMNAQ